MSYPTNMVQMLNSFLILKQDNHKVQNHRRIILQTSPQASPNYVWRTNMTNYADDTSTITHVWVYRETHRQKRQMRKKEHVLETQKRTFPTLERNCARYSMQINQGEHNKMINKVYQYFLCFKLKTSRNRKTEHIMRRAGT